MPFLLLERHTPLRGMTTNQLFFLLSCELLEITLSMTGILVVTILFRVNQLHGRLSTQVLCAISRVVELETVLQVLREPRIVRSRRALDHIHVIATVPNHRALNYTSRDRGSGLGVRGMK